MAEPRPRQQGHARYVIVGAGAVGGTFAMALHRSRFDVLLVARGQHRDRISEDGLEVRTRDETFVVDVPTASSISDVEFTNSDVVILSVKSEDTLPAIEALAETGSPGLPVVCAQNGVENERIALRYFEFVYSAMLILRSVYVEPGVIVVRDSPILGIADVGRFPPAVEDAARQFARDFTQSGFLSEATDRVLGLKYRKLIANLGNGLDLMVGTDSSESYLFGLAHAEAIAAFKAAGIEVASVEDFNRRRDQLVNQHPKREEAAPGPHVGGSTWQSGIRGKRRIEAPFLNGEIVLLGRLNGIPTPANNFLLEAAVGFARAGGRPGSFPLKALHQAYEAGDPPRGLDFVSA